MAHNEIPEKKSTSPAGAEVSQNVRERVQTLREKVEKLSTTFDRVERDLREVSES